MGRPRKYPIIEHGFEPKEGNMDIETVETVKKGNKTWSPSSVNILTGLDRQNFNYKWVSKDPSRVSKHLSEQWEFVDGNHKIAFESGNRIFEGGRITSNVEKHDAVLMRMPKEVAQQRAEFYNDLTMQSVKSLKKDAEQAAGASLTGKIEFTRNATVIE